MTRSALSYSLLPLLAACGSGGGDAGTASAPVAVVTAPTPTPTPSPTPTPAATPTPTPAPAATGFTASAAALYTAAPDIASCQPGQLSSQTTAAALASLNAIRALHRLPAVTYSQVDEAAAQQAALMQAANDQLSHTPPTSWKCYTSAGAAGSGSSNLYLGYGDGLQFQTDEQILAGWLTDVNNVTADNVGHRRWLLSPFLGTVAYGRVVGASPTQGRGDAAALKVFNNQGANPAGTLPPFVAYPFEDYPARYFNTGALLSFGVVAGAANSAANAQVNFAAATVTVQQRGGGTLAVSKQSSDNQGYGLPNNLQFAVAGLQLNTYYDVTITGVTGGGAKASYSYYFRIVG